MMPQVNLLNGLGDDLITFITTQSFNIQYIENDISVCGISFCQMPFMKLC